jgi:hypothetical protein
MLGGGYLTIGGKGDHVRHIAHGIVVQQFVRGHSGLNILTIFCRIGLGIGNELSLTQTQVSSKDRRSQVKWSRDCVVAVKATMVGSVWSWRKLDGGALDAV